MTKSDLLTTIRREAKAAGLSRQELNARHVYPRRPGAAPSLPTLNKDELREVLVSLHRTAR